MEEQNQRLKTGLSAVYQQDEKSALFLVAEQWNEALFVFVYPCHARHVRELTFQLFCILNNVYALTLSGSCPSA